MEVVSGEELQPRFPLGIAKRTSGAPGAGDRRPSGSVFEGPMHQPITPKVPPSPPVPPSINSPQISRNRGNSFDEREGDGPMADSELYQDFEDAPPELPHPPTREPPRMPPPPPQEAPDPQKRLNKQPPPLPPNPTDLEPPQPQHSHQGSGDSFEGANEYLAPAYANLDTPFPEAEGLSQPPAREPPKAPMSPPQKSPEPAKRRSKQGPPPPHPPPPPDLGERAQEVTGISDIPEEEGATATPEVDTGAPNEMQTRGPPQSETFDGEEWFRNFTRSQAEGHLRQYAEVVCTDLL